MITLGINAAFHDSAAALVADGVTIAAAEEERFSRIKHGKRPVPFSTWELPFNAIDYCLAEAGITLKGVDHVAYSFDPDDFPGAPAADSRSVSLPLVRAPHATEDWRSPWDALFTTYVRNAPHQLVDGAPHHLRARFQLDREPGFRWHFVNHHTCHQASAFLAAPFDRCAVLTLDGRGERATTSYGVYQDRLYRPLGEVDVPHSLGILYERVTSHLGFLQSSDEYKVMALAALGEPRYRDALAETVRVGNDGTFRVAPLDLEATFGPARIPGSALEQRHFDIAASLQVVLEETVLKLARWLRAVSDETALAMAGGVALNCVMNSRLRDAGIFDNVWVQPAAGDAGTALGAALWVDAGERDSAGTSAIAGVEIDETGETDESTTLLAPRFWRMSSAYLGPSYSDDEIEALLRWAKLSYRRVGDVEVQTARLLANNLIVGWFQGRMEFGPRALGARSILASPIDPAMQARMNELKDREDFRPVAPAIAEDDLDQWFEPAEANAGVSPFMLFVYQAREGQGERIPSACHTDHTARVQTVHPDTNARFYGLLKAFGQITGVPVLINTSFNVRGQPIVCSPRDALEAFFSTPLDALVIGSFLIEKGKAA